MTANLKYGQIASATYADKTENFLWDGLALIQRSVRPTAELPAFGTGSRITNFINEPYITGGNPILSSKGDVMFNDMLGTTLGVKSGEQVNQVNMTAFGEPARPAANGDSAKSQDAFFTGKPHIGELGYAFLFRNYRPDQGKWQTADPLGYPDGWNNLAYVNNKITTYVDPLGLWYLSITLNISLTFVGGPQLSLGLGLDTTTGDVNFTGTATGSVGIDVGLGVTLNVSDSPSSGVDATILATGGTGKIAANASYGLMSESFTGGLGIELGLPAAFTVGAGMTYQSEPLFNLYDFMDSITNIINNDLNLTDETLSAAFISNANRPFLTE